jgi:3-dehydrosphinganine reductase
MDFYRGKAVFITGGSSGIGLAAAQRLARLGAHVAIAARGRERLDSSLKALKEAAVDSQQRFTGVSCDVSSSADCARASAETLAALGGCDVVIANAGVAHPASVLDTPEEVYERMMRINYFGTVNTVRAFLPHLYARRSGHIGIVSSMLGFMGIYGYSAYAASKFAQVGFAECLRQESADRGVSVTLLYPPDTDTPQLAEENKIKPPETKAISGEVKTMSADEVAHEFLKGLAARTLNVVPGGMGKVTYWAKRVSPGLVNWVTDGALKKFRKTHPAQA